MDVRALVRALVLGILALVLGSLALELALVLDHSGPSPHSFAATPRPIGESMIAAAPVAGG